ncbi:MAG: TVP38/TMEM64 family protein [Actinomycetota bacterium]|nr:TVP38/TMEM64 family protein [Actinomycetota bacterium]
MLAALILGGTALFALSDTLAPSQIADAARGVGPAASVLFVICSAVLTTLAFPKPVLAVAAGLAFGTALGTPVAVVGASLGAAGSYLLARRFGRNPGSVAYQGKLALIDSWLGRQGFAAVLYARLLPVVPFAMVNYAAGVRKIRFSAFLSATVLGIIPSTYVLVALGGSFREPASRVLLASVVLVAAVAVAGPVARQAANRRWPRPTSCSDTGVPYTGGREDGDDSGQLQHQA